METKIFDYGMNGEGIAKIDGKITLVPNALVDEIVDIEIEKDNSNYSIASLKEIKQQSNSRITPICPYFEKCGGCQLQHMSYEEQLKFKTLNIKKTLKKITGIEFDVNETVSCSSPFSYRNKMSFSVKDSACGLLMFNSKEIVEIESCPIADNTINHVFKTIKTWLKTFNTNEIKNVVIRSISNQILVGIVTKKHLNLNPLLSTLKSQFVDIGLYEIVNRRNDGVVLCGKATHIGGIKEIKITDLGVTYSVDLLGFHQTNLEIQNKLYNSVLDYISCDDIVVNGFSGQGLLTAILAQKAKLVTGIEINKSSHESAEKLKKENNINNMRNICGDFHKHIKTEKEKANTIILDPTKKGCGKDVMTEINGIQNIIYISCNPIALCKDLNVIKDFYTIEEITPFDMFPQTINVETLVKLKKNKEKL